LNELNALIAADPILKGKVGQLQYTEEVTESCPPDADESEIEESDNDDDCDE
jgi:hypothetical protein